MKMYVSCLIRLVEICDAVFKYPREVHLSLLLGKTRHTLYAMSKNSGLKKLISRNEMLIEQILMRERVNQR